jgi:hypothetical protein
MRRPIFFTAPHPLRLFGVRTPLSHLAHFLGQHRTPVCRKKKGATGYARPRRMPLPLPVPRAAGWRGAGPAAVSSRRTEYRRPKTMPSLGLTCHALTNKKAAPPPPGRRPTGLAPGILFYSRCPSSAPPPGPVPCFGTGTARGWPFIPTTPTHPR